ncbi:hypothetical protein [Paludibacterium yongneupense]|uniref:hypothetical protein n=1 Tax=Paludibacterium yongneupense TaxID=400061 RepID=UPI0004136373|nr:hypothetical protein [Paludibacterium yongneupense]
MADISDVLNVLVGSAAAILYPSGTSSPSACGAPVKVYSGWPAAKVLEDDLRAGKLHVSVFPLPTERKTTRHIGRKLKVTHPGGATLTATVSGNTVAIGGAVSVPQNVYLLANGVGAVYAVQASDTLATIAAALAVLAQSVVPGASSMGTVLTLPGAHSVVARVGAVGTAIRETKRQEKQIQLSVWASTPSLRDTAASVLDSALSASSGIAFPDGSVGILLYSHSNQTDLSKEKLYRRDLIYTVDYATTQSVSAPQVIAPVLNVASQDSGQSITTIQE